MAVRVTGPRGVVPDHGGLDPFHRHLHLPVPGPSTSGRVRRDPSDDLGGGPVLSGIQRRGDLRVKGSCQ